MQHKYMYAYDYMYHKSILEHKKGENIKVMNFIQKSYMKLQQWCVSYVELLVFH